MKFKTYINVIIPKWPSEEKGQREEDDLSFSKLLINVHRI